MIILSLADDEWAEERGDDMSFLNRKLEPAKHPHVDGGCLPGTRKAFLSDVKGWLAPKRLPSRVLAIIFQMAYWDPLNNPEDSNTATNLSLVSHHFCNIIRRIRTKSTVDDFNVLWVSGAPGAGKTAFASTIVDELLILLSECAKLFIKRGATDPRTIWRSIAYELGDLHRGVKVDLLEVMSGKSRHAYPERASIEKQFDELVLGPLKRNFPDDPTSSRRIVVVIDALDECDMDKHDDWRAFLDTIIKWSKELPASCKLVVTSRGEAEIEKELKGISHALALDTGDRVSVESGEDIRRFLIAKFSAARKEDSQPDQDSMTRLTEYAAGLFVWAATVVRFVTQNGADRVSRLEMVLGNMAKVGEDDPIGSLYAQILLASGQELKERNSTNLFLASLVLLRDDLPKKALLALLAPNGLDSRSTASIETAIDSLKSIVVTEGVGEVFRVCHKSLSDFLLDEPRVHASMEKLLVGASGSAHKSIPNTYSLARQHALLAEGCLQLMNSALITCTGDTPTSEIPDDLMYAYHHWVDHLCQAGMHKDGGVNADIRLLPLIVSFAKEHIHIWLEVLSRSDCVSEAFNSLRNLLSYSSSPDVALSNKGVLDSITEKVDMGDLDMLVVRLQEVETVSSLFVRGGMMQLKNSSCHSATEPLKLLSGSF